MPNQIDQFWQFIAKFNENENTDAQTHCWMIPDGLKPDPAGIVAFFNENIEERGDETEAQWIMKSARRNFLLMLRRSFQVRHLDPLRAYIISTNTKRSLVTEYLV